LQLMTERLPVRKRTLSLRECLPRRVEQRLEPRLVERLGKRPRQARGSGTRQRLGDGVPAQRQARSDLPQAEPRFVNEPKYLSDLAHGYPLCGHRCLRLVNRWQLSHGRLQVAQISSVATSRSDGPSHYEAIRPPIPTTAENVAA